MQQHVTEIQKLRKQTTNLPQLITALEVAGYEVEYADYGVINVNGWSASKFRFNLKFTENLSTAGKAFYVSIPNHLIDNCIKS